MGGDRLQALLDRTEISDLLIRFARCLDDRDFVGYAALFTPDGRLTLPDGEHRGRSGLAEFVAADLDQYHRTQHLSTNHQILVDGSRATSRSALYAVHLRSGDDPTDWWAVGGWYDNTYRHEDGRWLIHTVDVTPIWLTEGRTPGPGFPP